MIIGILGGIILVLGLAGFAWYKGFNPFQKVTKLDHFEIDPNKMVGYMLANDLLQLPLREVAEMAETMAQLKINTSGAEGLSFSELGYYDNPKKAIDLLIPRMREFLKRNITFLLIPVNYNCKGICEPRFNLEWYAYLVNEVKKRIPADERKGILMLFVSEWGKGQRNKKCWKKAEEWCNWGAANWPWMKGWNKDARPNSAPKGHILVRNVASARSKGRRNALNTTDHTITLKQLKGWCCAHFDIPLTLAWLELVDGGKMVYHFAAGKIGATSGSKPDYPLIEAIGWMIKEGKL